MKILLPTDFSENSRKAVAYALKHYNGNAEFLLLNAFRPPHSAGMLISIDDFVKRDAEKSLKAELEFIRNKLNFKSGDIKTMAAHGFPRDVIIKIAEEEEQDLVIMGTKGATGLKEAFIGSNAAYVARKSSVPVITVPNNFNLESPKKIVLAVDFNENLNVESLAPLVDLCINFDTQLEVLHVLTGTEKEKSHQTKKDEIEHFLRGIKFNFHFTNNEDVINGIEEFVNANKPDILALIPMKMRFLEGLFSKSVTRKIEMHSDIPLLTLPNLK